MTEKGPDQAFTVQELTSLRHALTAAHTIHDTESKRMQAELEALQRRHAAELAPLQAAVATAKEVLDAALAHNVRVEKRQAYWGERFHHHCTDPAVRSEEELKKKLHADMAAFQA